MKQENKEFFKGVAVVLGWLARRGEDSLVEFGMNDNGINLGTLVAAGVEDFDLKPISKALRHD